MTPISDRDIYITANQLVKARGGRAIVFAEKKLTEMEDVGDDDGLNVWQRVMTAVFDLLRVDPGGEVN